MNKLKFRHEIVYDPFSLLTESSGILVCTKNLKTEYFSVIKILIIKDLNPRGKKKTILGSYLC